MISGCTFGLKLKSTAAPQVGALDALVLRCSNLSLLALEITVEHRDITATDSTVLALTHNPPDPVTVRLPARPNPRSLLFHTPTVRELEVAQTTASGTGSADIGVSGHARNQAGQLIGSFDISTNVTVR